MTPQRRHLRLYERALDSFGRSAAGGWYLKKIAPRLDPPLLRLTGGRVSSVYPKPVMLLTTTGAKTGKAAFASASLCHRRRPDHPHRIELRRDEPPGVVPEPGGQPAGRRARG